MRRLSEPVTTAPDRFGPQTDGVPVLPLAAPSTWSQVWTELFDESTRAVLDVGTGGGNVALLLSNLGYDVTGIDPSTALLEQARRKLADHPDPPEFCRGDADAPPFAPASFDAVVSRYVLGTLPDVSSAITAWREQLRPGGILVAVDGPESPEHGTASVVTALELAGFEQVRVDPLPEILELDLAGSLAPGRSPRRQYRFSARRRA